MNHTPPLHFDFKKGYLTGVAYWSKVPANKLVIFVHGFAGNAVETWIDFPGQLMLHSQAAGYDMVFLTYRSVSQSAETSSTQFHTFMRHFLRNPAKMVKDIAAENSVILDRPADFKYKRIVMVAHSLGACVVRRALLNQLADGREPWPKDIQLVLFAPAHHGSIAVSRIATAAVMGLPRTAAALLVTGGFVVESLTSLKEGSAFLTRLLQDAQATAPILASMKAKVFWKHEDRVVRNRDFPHDFMPAEDVHDVSHISICKPRGYDIALKGVLEELK